MAAPLFSTGFFMVFLAMWGGIGVPLGVPPLPEDPVIARMAGPDCLAYFASHGMAKPNAQSTNQAEQLFAEPEMKILAKEVERLIRSLLAQEAKRHGPGSNVPPEEIVDLVKILLTRPFGITLSHLQVNPGAEPDFRGGLIVNLGEQSAKIKAFLEGLQTKLPGERVKKITIAGETFHQFPLEPKGPNLSWGVKGPYLYAGLGAGELEALLQRANASVPKWLTDLHKQIPVERVSTVSRFNVKAITDIASRAAGPEVGKVLEATGLGGIEQWASVSGLDKEACVSRTLLTIQGEPKGLLQLAAQKPLTAAELSLIPQDATFATAFKLDLEKTYQAILTMVEKIEPRAAQQFRAGLAGGEQAVGLKLGEDLFQPFGDTWCLFDSPGEGGLFLGLTLVVSVKDASRLAETQKKLLALVEKFGGHDADGHAAGRGPRIGKYSYAGQDIFTFATGERGFPLAPSWCLTDKHLVVSLFPQSIKGFLSRGKDFQSLAKTPAVAAALAEGGDLLGLTHVDTKRIFDIFYIYVPLLAQMASSELPKEAGQFQVGAIPSAGAIRRHLVPSTLTVRRTAAGIEILSRKTVGGIEWLSMGPMNVALLLPAIQKVREASGRTQSMNNLRQIALANHNYHDQNGTFPPAYRADKNSKPLLSWRVLILPYIEQAGLYNRFHLDEPWDSEHNKKLIPLMPAIYKSPASHNKPGMTTYLTVRGPNTAFQGQKGVRMVDISDGTSNSIMAVEVPYRKAVIWTRPDDLEIDRQNPVNDLLGSWPGGFIAAFCDGSVRFIRSTIDPKTLEALFTINGGEVIQGDF